MLKRFWNRIPKATIHPVGMTSPSIKKFYFQINHFELGENKLRNQ